MSEKPKKNPIKISKGVLDKIKELAPPLTEEEKKIRYNTITKHLEEKPSPPKVNTTKKIKKKPIKISKNLIEIVKKPVETPVVEKVPTPKPAEQTEEEKKAAKKAATAQKRRNTIKRKKEEAEKKEDEIEKELYTKEIFIHPKIYYYGGHGSDVCEEDKLVKSIVPKDCIYITITSCGKNTLGNEIREKYFRLKDKEILDILQKPYLYKYKEKIAELLGVKKDDVHVKMPGKQYVVNNFIAEGWYDNPDYIGVKSAGLLEKTKMEDIKKGDFIIYKQVVLGDLNAYFPLKTTKYSREKVKTFILEKIKIYSPGETEEQKKDRLNTIFKILKFETKESLTLAEVMKTIYEYGMSITKEDFLNLYSASVLPTKEEVKPIVEAEMSNTTDRLSPTSIRKILGKVYSYLLLKHKNITNEFMMKTYPGIHYNVVCRSIQKHCARKKIHKQMINSNTEEVNRLGRAKTYYFNRIFSEIEGIKNSSTLNTTLKKHRFEKKNKGNLYTYISQKNKNHRLLSLIKEEKK